MINVLLTPISFLDLTKVRAHGSGFLLAHWLWTVYLQPGRRKTQKRHKMKTFVYNVNKIRLFTETGEGFLLQIVQSARCMAAPCRWLWALTGATESLLPQPEKHALANAAVCWLVKMFHPPNMLPVPLCHLQEIEHTENSSFEELNGADSLKATVTLWEKLQ